MRWQDRLRSVSRGSVAAAVALALWSVGTFVAPLIAHADGWHNNDQLPVALHSQVALTDGTYFYIFGGINSGAQSAAYSALINADGTLGAWQTLPALPQRLANHAGVLQSGQFFILGGQNSGGTAQSVVYSAAQQTGGGLGAWSTLAPLPQALYEHAAVAAGGYVFVIGGFGADNTARSTVYSAQQNGATLDAWTAQTPLPVALGEIGAAVNNNHIYVVSGQTAPGGSGVNTVYSAAIGANGTISAWSTLTALPQVRWDASVTIGGGYLWTTGGFGANSRPTPTIYRAPLHADGTLGAWLALTPAPALLGEHTATIAMGDLFLAGGKVGASGASKTIYVAPVAGPWLMLSSYSVKTGAKIHVKGTGFTANEQVTITFNGTVVATAHADSTGSFGINGSPGTNFVVPTTTIMSSYPVVGTGKTSGGFGQAALAIT